MKNVLLTIVTIFIFSLICHPTSAAETVIIHEVIDQKKENHNLKLETIQDLATIVSNIKNGQSKLGYECSIEDIYFDGDSTHVNISCRKILP